jgi:hypothetical protein
MRAFIVCLNGEQLCVAGTGESGVLTAIITHAAGPVVDDLFLDVGGLESKTGEHLRWGPYPHRKLAVGDEITVKVTKQIPSTRRMSDTA